MPSLSATRPPLAVPVLEVVLPDASVLLLVLVLLAPALPSPRSSLPVDEVPVPEPSAWVIFCSLLDS